MSFDFTNAAALQDYIRKFMPDLISKVYHGFPSASIFTPHEGVKGELVFTEMILGDIAQKWTKLFTPLAGKFTFSPRTGRVYPYKVDLQAYPQEWEQTYLGMARRPGFQPDDLPYQGFIMGKIIEKLLSEFEITAFQGERDASPADGAPLINLIDGLLTIVADEITATNLTPVTTAAHTTSNAVANAEAVHAALDPVYQNMETVMFCSLDFARKYFSNQRSEFKKYVGVEKTGVLQIIPLDFGNCSLVPTYGMGTSSRLICTPKANLHYMYDLEGDAMNIRVQNIHRSMDIMIDGKIGFDFGIVHDKILAVNNLS